MSEPQISIEDFVDAVRETAERSGTSSEFKSFVLALYERVVSRQRRNIFSHSHYLGITHNPDRLTGAKSSLIALRDHLAEIEDLRIFYSSGPDPLLLRWLRPEESFRALINEDSRWIYQKLADAAHLISLKSSVEEWAHSPDCIFAGHQKLDDSDSEDLNEIGAMLTSMERQVDDAIQQIGQSRKDVEESLARTQPAKEATEKILASIGKQ